MSMHNWAYGLCHPGAYCKEARDDGSRSPQDEACQIRKGPLRSRHISSKARNICKLTRVGL
jgi:hypothetical protein